MTEPLLVEDPTIERLYNEQGVYRGKRKVILDTDQPKVRRGTVIQFSDPYLTLFLPMLDHLAGDDLPVYAYRVLIALLARGEQEGRDWEIRPKEIAAVTGVAVSRISTTVTLLVDHGYLIKTTRGHVAYAPKLAWRGTTLSRERSVGRLRGVDL